MKLRSTPRTATWFLREYCPNPQDESVVGDLIEQYQRGRGRTWYWLQVVTIVLAGLFREVGRNRQAVVTGLVKAWLVRGFLHTVIALMLMVGYRSQHPFAPGMTSSGFPLLTIQVGNEIQWALTAVTVIASLVILAMIGMDLASSSRVRPRPLVLTYLTLFLAATMASIAVHTGQLFLNQRNALGFLTLDLFALLAAPALILWGASLRKKKTEAASLAS